LSEINIDRVRLERFNEVRGKKLEKLENETKEMKYLQNIDVNKLMDNFQRQGAEIDVLKRKEEKFEEILKTFERNYEIKLKALQHDLNQEIELKNQAMQKAELLNNELYGLRLTQQDPTSLWMEK